MPQVKNWGSAILSRPGRNLRPFADPPESDLERHSLLTMAIASVGSREMVLASVHAPVREARRGDLGTRDPAMLRRPSHTRRGIGPYRTDAAYGVCRDRVRDSRFFLAGDWNVSRLWDERRMISECHEFFDRAAADGWHECSFRQPELRTWYRGSEPPYQLDHAFCDAETANRVSSVKVDPHPAETLKVSDHAPLLFELTESG